MVFSKILLPNRGTKLYKNNNKTQHLKLTPKDSKNLPPASEIMYIAGKKISRFSSLKNNKEHTLTIYKTQEYMIINLSRIDINIEFSSDPANHAILYDPYRFENQIHNYIDIDELKTIYNVPNGFIDVLSKWYSIKFTYPEINYIFLKPGLGISYQIHEHRSEFWEIGFGNPIIIINEQIEYYAKKGDKFSIPKGTPHAIINPTSDWILIKETFTGTFDEMDINRIFNPNNY